MLPKLCAFDLDGTLLRSDKTLSPANIAALTDMAACGCTVAIASGRIGSSIIKAVSSLSIDIALIALNGAAVYKNRTSTHDPVYGLTLPALYSDHLIDYAAGRNFAFNYYHDGRLYAVRNKTTAPWIDIYIEQTASPYEYVGSLDAFRGRPPYKAIFVGDKTELDIEEERFTALWGDRIYLVRTWDHYLEFLHRDATKGLALAKLAASLGIGMHEVVAFGDAANDIPMLKAAGIGIAMKNADDQTKSAASHVSVWTNDEDGVAREWERIKQLPPSTTV